MFEHVVFHGAVEEQENIQTKGVINFGGGKSQKKRKENMKAATVNIKKAWGSNKRCSQRMEEVQNKEKHGRGNAYMDPTHRIKGMLILNGKNFLLIYSLTLSCRI